MNKEEMLKELRRTNENYPPAYKTLESVSKVMPLCGYSIVYPWCY